MCVARGATGMTPLRVFGVVSAVAILLLTVIYAVVLCLYYRSDVHVISASQREGYNVKRASLDRSHSEFNAF